MTEERNEFRELFEGMSDPAIVVDGREEHVLACNDAFTALVMRSFPSLKGRDISSSLTFERTRAGAAEEARAHDAAHATVFVNGEYPLHIAVECIGCHWEDEAATTCIVRGIDRETQEARDGDDDEEMTSDETSALFEYLREATEQLEVVNRVVAAVNSSRTIDQVFTLASGQMRALIPFDRASIALIDPEGEHLSVFALSGEYAEPLSVGARAPMRGSVTELALQKREMIVIPELSAEKRFNVYDDLESEGFRSAVCVPLFSDKGPIGSLNLTSRMPEAYTRKHLLALERLAPPLAIAIEKVLLLEQAERRSREMEASARREELAGRIGRQLSSSLDAPSVLQETVDVLGQTLGADRCHVTLFDRRAEYALVGYEFVAHAGIASMRGHRIPLLASEYARRVLASDSPVAVEEIERLPPDELLRLYERLGVRAVMAAPIIMSGAPEGLLELHDCSSARRWTEDDTKLLGMVAREVSLALTNARLYEASRRRSEELEGLYKISRAFSTLTDISEIYGRLTRAIAQLVGGERCLIATYDRRHNAVRAEAPGYNTLPELIEEFRFTLDQDGASSYIYRTGEAFYSNDPASDPRLNQSLIMRYGVRSVLCVPMRIKRELIGFIYVANRPGGFRERDVQLLEIFAAQAAETIANARLFATIQAQAEREAVVNRLVLSLQQTSEAKRGVDVVVERVGELLELDRCIVMLFGEDERADFLGEWCASGVNPISEDPEIQERSPVAHWIRTHRQPLVISDVTTHSLSDGIEDLNARMNLCSLAVVPIMHQGRVIGSLSAHQTARRRAWAQDDVELLMAVATQVGSTLENARLISELREANRLKDEFLATLSHELRTPLTAIKGWVELLSESEALLLDEELAEGLGVIKVSTASLSQLISDLLDLSRIQRKGLRLERQPSDINKAVLEAVGAVRQAAIERRQELRLELNENLPTAYLDAHRVQQILWNLLSNAIKFTPEGGRITVRSRLVTPDGILIEDEEETEPMRWVVVEVEDTGEGIPPDFLPFVWDRFRQADGSSTRRHGGLGIGLALVKELVEAHGGHVEARSDGGGTIFTVRLPLENFSASMDESAAVARRRGDEAGSGHIN
ncbi:MAG TPA: GAF domain-containing protein [Pyrinomonadaceae bacterium]|jgi:GAF domain-containing protein|nr:GAF domain-containing protein [Pyrinomonadaceae bacterium]